MSKMPLQRCADAGHPPSEHFHSFPENRGNPAGKDGSFHYDETLHHPIRFSHSGAPDALAPHREIVRTRAARRQAVLDLVIAEMNRTDENYSPEPGEDKCAGVETYLDDAARRLLTIVEVPS